MPEITANVLYEMLLEKKRNNADYDFNSMDLRAIGNVEQQYNQLVNDGKIIEKNDVIGSFDVIG